MASADREPAGRRRRLAALLLAHLLLCATAAAEDDELPDLELLAYLGSWTDSDEEWVAVVEWDGRIDADAPREPAPSEENDDE